MQRTTCVFLKSRVQRHVSGILHLSHPGLCMPNFLCTCVDTYKYYHTHLLKKHVPPSKKYETCKLM